MFHLKPWAVFEVPAGVSSDWRHVNNDAEEQFTSFAMNDDYFAVGSKYGVVEILHRVSLDQIATFKISSPAPITKIRFSEVDKQALSLNGTKIQDNLIARNASTRQNDSSKNVFIGVVIAGWKVEVWRLIHPAVSDPKGKILVEMKRQNSLHAGSVISAISWASDRDLFTGDESGVVTVTRVQSRNLLTGSCQQLFKLRSPVVQIDFCAPILLVSTHTTIALSNISRQVFREVPLEKDGPFGAVLKVVDKNATFLAESVRESYLKAVCAGPDAMIWIVNVESYETERAYCFKGLVLERMKASSNMEMPVVEKQNGLNKSEEIVAVLPDERRPSSQLDEINLKSIEETQSSESSNNSVKVTKKDHLTICQLFNFGKGIVIGECSGGLGCVVLDVFNKSVMIAGKNFGLEQPCSEMFVHSRQKLVTIFQPTGDLKCFLVQPIHRMLKNTATDERYKTKSAELILRFPSIACNYLTQQEITDVADVLEADSGITEQVGKVRELAAILGNEKRARFENSNRSENEFDPYFQEVETPHTLFKTGGSTMKSLISNIQSKISDYEVTMAESKLAKARLNYAVQVHEDTATEVVENLANETENLVKVAASQITIEGVERVVFSPSEKLEPIQWEQPSENEIVHDTDLPPIHHLADIAIDDSLQPITPLNADFEEPEDPSNSDFQIKTKMKLKSFLNKVAENVETLSQKKASTIETQSVALEEEVCSYVEYMGVTSPVGWDKNVPGDVVRSVWVVGPGNRQQLIVPQGSSSSGHKRKETTGLDVEDGKDSNKSKAVTSHGQKSKKKRQQGHKQRKKERTAFEHATSYAPSSEYPQQNSSSPSLPGSPIMNKEVFMYDELK
ncbi:uncharacterized protein LOC142358315 [Convolutriloba macropyga]|uniref:uncharacterized protein LOC142358315 n=1 Tax=Convolutriloba macropyga TaxID=536237 RepID=UPI003F522727